MASLSQYVILLSSVAERKQKSSHFVSYMNRTVCAQAKTEAVFHLAKNPDNKG